MKIRLEIIKAQSGHTIVESLVALVILSAVLLATGQLALRLANAGYNQELSSAVRLAGSAMENIFLTGNYKSTQQTVYVGNQEWVKECDISFENNLVHASVFVKPALSSKWTYSLYTCRIVNDLQKRAVSPLWN